MLISWRMAIVVPLLANVAAGAGTALRAGNLMTWQEQSALSRPDAEIGSIYKEYLIGNLGAATCDGEIDIAIDSFAPARYSIIANTLFFRVTGEHWAEIEGYHPLDRALTWVGVTTATPAADSASSRQYYYLDYSPSWEDSAAGGTSESYVFSDQPSRLIAIGSCLIIMTLTARRGGAKKLSRR